MLAGHLAVSGGQAVVGAVLGILLGGVLGALCFSSRWAQHLVLGPMIAIQVTPVIAIAPLITCWLGYGFAAKTSVATLVSCYPMMLATMAGLAAVKRNHVWLVRLAGANWWREFLILRLRAATAAILPSISVSITLAVVGSVIADFIAGDSGLGFLILASVYQSKGAQLIAAVIGTALLGQTLLYTGQFLTRRFVYAELSHTREP